MSPCIACPNETCFFDHYVDKTLHNLARPDSPKTRFTHNEVTLRTRPHKCKQSNCHLQCCSIIHIFSGQTFGSNTISGYIGREWYALRYQLYCPLWIESLQINLFSSIFLKKLHTNLNLSHLYAYQHFFSLLYLKYILINNHDTQTLSPKSYLQV